MYLKRDLSTRILSGAQQIPVVAIIGPRQSGKSTLCKHLFPDHVFVDMQDAGARSFAQEDPKGFLETYKNDHGIIIDEAQYAPALFPQIKVEADKNPQSGYFILTGSQNFLLHEKISESLAGRVYFYTLLPFSIKELQAEKLDSDDPANQILQGFYPRVYQPQINTAEYYQNYLSTYVERDIRSIRNIEDIVIFKKFMELCALRIGSPLNLASLAADCGVSVITAKNWLSLLNASFIIFLMPSYHDNLSKRLIKAPKLFFYDVGLATAITKANRTVFARQRTLYGSLFENMIIVDCIKNLNSLSSHYSLSFLRDTNMNEIDLIIEADSKVVPIEIKSSQEVTSRFFDTMLWFNAAIKNQELPVVIYGGNQVQKRSNGLALPWTDVAKLVSGIF